MTAHADLARLLIETGCLDAARLERAMLLATESGEPLPLVLARLGLVPEPETARLLARLHRLELARTWPEAPVVPLPARFLREVRAVPVGEDGDVLLVAVADPADDYPVAAIAHATGRPVVSLVATPTDIEAAIERLYGGTAPVQAADAAAEIEDVARLKDLAAEAPVIRLVNALIARAVDQRASDIHIEPTESEPVVRLRVDGVLRPAEAPPRRLLAAVVSRIKIMARLDIAERRLPQDGRTRLSVRGRDVDLRVSTLPAIHGESVVLRILDRSAVALDLAALGLAGEPLAAWRALLARPNSIALVTGPTGSGKTTTLYASLSELDRSEAKVVTVEDPVEYHLAGITQIQVQPRIGLDFAAVLRGVLRHDPDVVMIGEIRDLETAEIAVQAALTGHLVLSTLHTSSAAGTIARLLDMGVPEYLIASALSGIAAQRLVRTLCPACRQPYEPAPELAARLGLEWPVRLWRPVGCDECGGSGYRGRTTVIEVLTLTEPLRRLVLARTDAAALARAAAAEGMRPILEDGLAKALAGVTSLAEVLRLTGDGES
ncbi:GspE/PulE family protein [Magnetospirillum sp. UT-4]|uniref:GspE/PulE family protein n=1 Tax=Magnetospirillum sp. UT-4 TaxID=2681467 RepID=UPI001383A034|nr:GspE/PulE family protein [Magnetospirillum sp. UT-4]CAA7621431.1 general secretory pathway component, cryptic [Magnetospirillum sp. UT-4]